MPRGGKRAGSGRKKTKLSRETAPLTKATAEAILASQDEKERWLTLLNAETTISLGKSTMTVPDLRLRFDVLKYLTDRRDGKAPQSVELTGKDGNPVKILLIGREAQHVH